MRTKEKNPTERPPHTCPAKEVVEHQKKMSSGLSQEIPFPSDARIIRDPDNHDRWVMLVSRAGWIYTTTQFPVVACPFCGEKLPTLEEEFSKIPEKEPQEETIWP